MDTKINHPLLGELTVRRSARAGRVSITVRPTEVRLTLPMRYSLQQAVAFAESKREWIEQARDRARRRAVEPLVLQPPFATRLHELEIVPGEVLGFRIDRGRMVVKLPEGVAVSDPQAQAVIRRAITEARRLEAYRILPERVAHLAESHGFRYEGLSFRNTLSRWGSCSARNTISLSINLMALPDRLVDYVILHELCHTREKNHGPSFHALLNRVTAGLHLQLNRELKGYSPKL
ncbi:MAG: M48 family metallopeptidase [Rikenellaceae bacterium]|nr:M48 family metallopeptidase [Rikenellaceae bacterium]